MAEKVIDIKNPVGANTRLHFNPELEIVYVTKGYLEVVTGAQFWTVQSGHAIIVMPYFTHTFNSSPDCEAVVMMFARDIFHNFDEEYRGLVSKNYVFEIEPPLRSYADYLLNNLNSENDRYIAEALFSAFVCSYVSDNSFAKSIDSTQEILPKMVEYIFNNIEFEIDLDALSANIGYSRRKLSHIFYKQTDMTISAFINFLRIDRAKTLLNKTNLSITEIAGKCGFNSIRSFNRQFSAQTDSTPTEFRKTKKSP